MNYRILAVLLLAALVLRLLTLMMIHTGVDERDYWSAGAALVTESTYPELQHRTVRWSLILPVAATQLLLGTHPNVYYVAPLLVGLAQVAIVFLLGVRTIGTAGGFLAALGVMFFPYMIRGASQIRPGTFSLLYILIALALFVRYLELPAGRKACQVLALSALVVFLAYMSKITNVYFVPGFLLAIILLRRSPRDAVVFAGVLLGLFLLETGAYAVALSEPLGRLGIIMGNHLGSGYIEPMSFWGIFRRYSPQNLPPYWMAPMLLYPVAAIYLHRRRRSAALDTMSLLVASFLFGMTFAVTGLNPVVPVEAFLQRYFLAILGMLVLIDAAFVVDLWDRYVAPRLPLPGIVWPFYVVPLAGVLVLGVVFASGVLPDSLSGFYNDPLAPRRHPLWLNVEYRKTIDAAFRSGTPLVARPGVAGDNALRTATFYYLSRDLYVPGPPPKPRTGTSEEAEYRYLFAEPQQAAAPVYFLERNPFRVRSMRFDAALEAMQKPEEVEVQ
ncbi:MAG: glycosyltransferase family 39 protein [Spirochaetota bacterium]